MKALKGEAHSKSNYMALWNTINQTESTLEFWVYFYPLIPNTLRYILRVNSEGLIYCCPAAKHILDLYIFWIKMWMTIVRAKHDPVFFVVVVLVWSGWFLVVSKRFLGHCYVFAEVIWVVSSFRVKMSIFASILLNTVDRKWKQTAEKQNTCNCILDLGSS